MDTSMQLTINSFRPLSPDKIFPWHFPDISLTFSKIPDISLTAVKFPDISKFCRFSRQVVTLIICSGMPTVANNAAVFRRSRKPMMENAAKLAVASDSEATANFAAFSIIGGFCRAMHSAAYAVVVRWLSVRPSVHHVHVLYRNV